ncbi:hypothetical protein [Roseibium sp. LAB1]
MTELNFTHHALARARQRGFRENDAEIVYRLGTPVAKDAVQLTNKDVADAIEKMKREMRQLERLRGSKVIVEGDTLITLYHETQRHRRRDRKRFRRQP